MSRYANVTATLALVVALSGTAYAAVTITGRNVRDHSLTGADIRANSIRSGQVAGLRLGDFASGQLSDRRGPRGPAGPAGQTGPAGPAGSALAYASVAADGTVDPDLSSGIALKSTGDGTYCLDRPAGSVKNFQATLRWVALGQPPSGSLEATADPGTITTAGCPAGTDVLVVTGRGGVLLDLPFYIAVIA